jgi:hypothetical protein
MILHGNFPEGRDAPPGQQAVELAQLWGVAELAKLHCLMHLWMSKYWLHSSSPSVHV